MVPSVPSPAFRQPTDEPADGWKVTDQRVNELSFSYTGQSSTFFRVPVCADKITS